MVRVTERHLRLTKLNELLSSVWPRFNAADSEAQRRRKVAVRSGHAAMAAMVVIPVIGSIGSELGRLPVARVVALLTAAILYVGWNLHGTSAAVRVLLWDGASPVPDTAKLPVLGALRYFALQLGLAALVYSLGDRGRVPNLVWLTLLPPVAYSVILLGRSGTAFVSVTTLLILTVNVVYWHGWKGVPYALLAFSFAMLFTLVFTSLAVSAETARNEVQRLAGQLGEANTQLREYAAQVEELAATRERNRLARELHDTLGHCLTVVNMQIQAARALSNRDAAHAQAAMEKAQALTEEGLHQIRQSVAALRTSPVDDRPLEEVLRGLVEDSCQSGLPTELRVMGMARPLTPQVALTLYRAGQEGLTNIRKHARATRATLGLDFREPLKVRLQVCDDGVGGAANGVQQSGFGLLGLRERAQLLGGEMSVCTAPGAGFSLEVEVPG